MTGDHVTVSVTAASSEPTDRSIEEVLREREQQYRSIFDSTGDGLIIVYAPTSCWNSE